MMESQSQNPQERKPSPPIKKAKITLAEKREFLVQVKESIQRKYQQVLGQLELIDEMAAKGVDISKIEIDNTEGIASKADG